MYFSSVVGIGENPPMVNGGWACLDRLHLETFEIEKLPTFF